jgi:AcrR family transcriptional regulator
MARTSYHHGALRDALIAASVELIEREGIGAVSLRRVARAAGVSPGAPYHHFADRAALLAAIAVQGYERLGPELRRAREQAPTPERALGALIETYVAFARRHPAHVHLMLRGELAGLERHPEAQAAGAELIALLADVVEDCRRAGAVTAADTETLVHAVWALCVGLVTLWLDGPLEGRCVQLGTTPEALSADVAGLLERLLRRG